MKKLLCLVAVLALLMAGCGAEVAMEEITTEKVQTQTEQSQEEWAVLTPPLDYEIINGLAKTPTHYYAPHEGGIVRAPIDDIARVERVPLPGSYEGMKLSGAEICGITEEWLFVNIWEVREKERHGPDDYGEYYEYENYENRAWVTYRIAMEGWKAEAVAAGVYSYIPRPWYNAVSDSLLIPIAKDSLVFEAMSPDTRKCSPVTMDGKQLSIGVWSSWWENTLEGNAVLVDCQTSEKNDYYSIDRDNCARQEASDEVNLAKYWDWREGTPKNKAEEILDKEKKGPYVTCGEYTYYMQDATNRDRRDFYRMNTDGTGRKLLRESTNIFQLCSAGGKLFCQAWHPTIRRGESRQIDIYLLDENGKVKEVLFNYWDNTEGNSGYGLASYGEKLMVTYSVIYGPGYFEFLYDPATGARFPAG